VGSSHYALSTICTLIGIIKFSIDGLVLSIMSDCRYISPVIGGENCSVKLSER
jgi:hypothetical protein